MANLLPRRRSAGEMFGAGLGQGLSAGMQQLMQLGMQDQLQQIQQKRYGQQLAPLAKMYDLPEGFERYPREIQTTILKDALGRKAGQELSNTINQFLRGGEATEPTTSVTDRPTGITAPTERPVVGSESDNLLPSEKAALSAAALSGKPGNVANALSKIGEAQSKRKTASENLEFKKTSKAWDRAAPYLKELRDRKSITDEQNIAVDEMRKLIEGGELPGPLWYQFAGNALKKFGIENPAAVFGSSAEAMQALGKTFLKQLPKIFKGKASIELVKMLEKTFPGLANTPEGSMRMLDIMEKINDLNDAEYKAAYQIIEENKGTPTNGLDQLAKKRAKQIVRDKSVDIYEDLADIADEMSAAYPSQAIDTRTIRKKIDQYKPKKKEGNGEQSFIAPSKKMQTSRGNTQNQLGAPNDNTEGWGSYLLRNAAKSPFDIATNIAGLPGYLLNPLMNELFPLENTGPELRRSAYNARKAALEAENQPMMPGDKISERPGVMVPFFEELMQAPDIESPNVAPTTEQLREYLPDYLGKSRPEDWPFEMASALAPVVAGKGLLSIPGVLKAGAKAAGFYGGAKAGGFIGKKIGEKINMPKTGEAWGSAAGALAIDLAGKKIESKIKNAPEKTIIPKVGKYYKRKKTVLEKEHKNNLSDIEDTFSGSAKQLKNKKRALEESYRQKLDTLETRKTQIERKGRSDIQAIEEYSKDQLQRWENTFKALPERIKEHEALFQKYDNKIKKIAKKKGGIEVKLPGTRKKLQAMADEALLNPTKATYEQVGTIMNPLLEALQDDKMQLSEIRSRLTALGDAGYEASGTPGAKRLFKNVYAELSQDAFNNIKSKQVKDAWKNANLNYSTMKNLQNSTKDVGQTIVAKQKELGAKATADIKQVQNKIKDAIESEAITPLRREKSALAKRIAEEYESPMEDLKNDYSKAKATLKHDYGLNKEQLLAAEKDIFGSGSELARLKPGAVGYKLAQAVISALPFKGALKSLINLGAGYLGFEYGQQWSMLRKIAKKHPLFYRQWKSAVKEGGKGNWKDMSKVLVKASKLIQSQ